MSKIIEVIWVPHEAIILKVGQDRYVPFEADLYDRDDAIADAVAIIPIYLAEPTPYTVETRKQLDEYMTTANFVYITDEIDLEDF